LGKEVILGRKFLIFIPLGVLIVVFSAVNVSAVPFTGIPSPSLSPTFGTLIDFDDQATGTLVGEFDYVSLGVASVKETESLGTFARYSGAQSIPNYIGTGVGGDRGDNGSGWDGTILFEFTGLASRVGIGIANGSYGPENLSIYDSNFILLESITGPTGKNTYAGFERTAADIKYFEIIGDFFAIDDLQHNALEDRQPDASVPEPSTLLMLGSGLVGLVGFGRKKFIR
jgi:hypothetical protein